MKSILSFWIITGLLLGGVVLPSRAQVSPSAGQNYVVEQTPRTAQSSVSLSSSYQDVQATVSYADGLGRPLQTVQVRGAGDASADIVTKAVNYDAYGRVNQTFLPLPGGVGGALQGSLRSTGSSFYGDANPYQETVYEASPLDRPTQQWGAGQNWRSASKRQQISYGVAPANSVIRFKLNLFSNVIYGAIEGGSGWDYFGPHDIATRTLTDEQDHTVIEYTDIQGRMVRRDVLLSGSQRLTTMYVYDNYERLGMVIPPKLYDWFIANGSGQALYFSNPDFTQSCYVYIYDRRGRLIRKHVPSAGWTDLVYDQQDRLVMSRDQQDVADEVWRYTRYDGLSRQTQTGRWPLGRAADSLRYDFTLVSHEDFPSTANFPAVSLLTENVYDTYAGSPLSFDAGSAYATPWSNSTGLLTRTGVRNLGSPNDWYSSAFWYDDKGRIIQSQSQNHLGGVNRVNNQYRFNGELLTRSIWEDLPTYSLGPASVETYAYDHLSRPVSVSFTPEDSPFEMARYVYDGIGRLSQKLIQPNGSSTGGGGNSITRTANPPAGTTLDQAPDFVEILPDNFNVNFQSSPSGIYEAKIGPATGVSSGTALQTLDYRYHVRGWLRGINVDASGQPALTSSQNDLFGYGLAYETAGYYDGNIGQQRWLGSQQPTQIRQYSYSYDAAKRLSSAAYSGASGEDYSLSGMGYDANGNITALTRTGIDQLSYSYPSLSNQVTAITDAISGTVGFADGHTGSDDYAYWPDGSLKKDLNRGISQIDYNILKLPNQITYSSGKVVSLTYTASGQKLRMSVSGGETRDYLPHSEHVNGQFGHMLTPEGRVLPGCNSGCYEYYYTDHLGSVRVAYGDSLGVLKVRQRRDYDPWGLELSALGSGYSTNRLKFNGKEGLFEIGSGMLDYGARLYDVARGQWGVIDPMAEKAPGWSGYRYGFDNPVNVIDPDGQFEYSNGYVTQDSQYTTGAMEFNGVYQNDSGDGPGKGQPTAQQQQADRQASYRRVLSNSPNLQRVYAGMSISEKAQAVGGSVDAIESDNATNFAVGSIAATAIRSFLGRFFRKPIEDIGETFYRAMSNESAEAFLSTGKLPAGTETFISPTKSFAQNYSGTLFEINVKTGTTSQLEAIGVRNLASAHPYGNLPLVEKGWKATNAFFKVEGSQVNIGLGNGKALNIFNSNIQNFRVIK